MERRKLKVVVTGFIGLMPAGGVTWDYIQYPLGFRELGCDVLYLEDTQVWPTYHSYSGETSCAPNVEYLRSAMHRFDMDDCWSYRDEVTDKYFGMPEEGVRRFCKSADLFVNVSCATPLRDEYAAIPLRVMVDTDPMFTQVQVATGRTLYNKDSALPDMAARHTHLFTFGENMGRSGCEVPLGGRRWIPTRQPIVLKYWPSTALPESGSYTTVLNWTAAKEFDFQGRTWGQKSTEFLRFLHVPRQAPDVSFMAAVGQTTGDPFPADLAQRDGWHILNAQTVAADIDGYQHFIRDSRAEFSIAKQTYVQAKTGWFSCRSACYLASGRPVVTQDTGWSEFIPNGCGLFPFSDTEGALGAIRQIESDPEKHARAARQVAEAAFDSNKVLARMLSELGL